MLSHLNFPRCSLLCISPCLIYLYYYSIWKIQTNGFKISIYLYNNIAALTLKYSLILVYYKYIFFLFVQNATTQLTTTTTTTNTVNDQRCWHAHNARHQRNAMPELSPGTSLLFAIDHDCCRYVNDDDIAPFATTATSAAATAHVIAVSWSDDDNAEEPPDSRPAVFRETLRGGTDGARLPVYILLHPLPELPNRQVNLQLMHKTI